MQNTPIFAEFIHKMYMTFKMFTICAMDNLLIARLIEKNMAELRNFPTFLMFFRESILPRSVTKKFEARV